MTDLAALPDEGRTLDAMIAEKVMGWREVGCEANRHHTEFVPFGIPLGEHRRVLLPAFSTDISDAWKVHMKMCDELFSVRQRYLTAIQMETRKELSDQQTGLSVVAWPDVLVVLRHRFPEAICLAALASRVPENKEGK